MNALMLLTFLKTLMKRGCGANYGLFFTEIGNKFAPLWKEDIPVTDRTEDDIFIEEQEVQKRLHACKKPKGLLSGDVFPFLLTKHTHLLAKPLTRILNAAFKQEVWPDVWELETVLIIPKVCLLYTSPSPRDRQKSRMPSSA